MVVGYFCERGGTRAEKRSGSSVMPALLANLGEFRYAAPGATVIWGRGAGREREVPGGGGGGFHW